jgi:hypothetical protein
MENIHEILLKSIQSLSATIFLLLLLTVFITAFRKINSKETIIRYVAYGIIVRTLLLFIFIAIFSLTKNKSFFGLNFENILFSAEYILPFLLFNSTLTGKHKLYFNFSISLSFILFISTMHINKQSAMPLGVSISYVGLSITTLTGSFFYFMNLSKIIKSTNLLQEPSFVFVLGFFLSQCLSLLNNISILTFDIFSDFKHYPLKGSQSNLKIPLLTSYLIDTQKMLVALSDIICYSFVIKGLSLGSNRLKYNNPDY